MDRAQLLLVGLPIFLFCSDLLNLFTPPPPPPKQPTHHHYQPRPKIPQQALDFPIQSSSGITATGIGSTVTIHFCSSCSYRGNAVKTKTMLETEFPGINVILENYPPTLPKRLLSKAVTAAQFGIVGIVIAGEQIFPRLGFVAPPPWYYSLAANKFRTISSSWLLGNFIQSFLQSSGAFEVYCNGGLVFSKLQSQRFPGEIELKDLVAKTLEHSRIVNGNGEGLWS